MKRFWDYELNEKENIKLERILKEIPTFEEFAGGLPSQEDVDDYERLYGDTIRAARDSATE